MKPLCFVPLVFAALLASGCSNPTADSQVTDGSGGSRPGEVSPASPDFAAGGGADLAQTASPSPVVLAAGAADISQENAQISFVGSKPDGSRHDGGFGEFTGTIEVDPETQALRRVAVEIKTDQLWSDNERLTRHLKSPDFFNVNEHPLARFESSNVEAAEAAAGKYTLHGPLTLLGVTQEIAIPVTVNVVDDVLTLEGAFEIDRTQFGMNYGPGEINNAVALTVSVGTPTTPSAAGGAGRGPGGRGGPGGRFDPQAMFAQWDTDGDGKLSGDEIPDRMRERLDQTDADGDGAVTLEEWQERIRQMREQRGGGFGGGGGGRRGGGENGPPGGDQPGRQREGGQDRPQRPEAE